MRLPRLVLSSVLLGGLWGSMPALDAASPDLSTPAKAAIAFGHAIDEGDFETAKAAAIGTDADFEIIRLRIAFFDANKKLRAAAVERFGVQGRQIPEEGMMSFSGQLREAVELIKGDDASFGQPKEDYPLRLKRVGGLWKVDLWAIPGKDHIAAAMPKMCKILDDCAAEIRAGRYPTVAEARKALSERIFAMADEQLKGEATDRK